MGRERTAGIDVTSLAQLAASRRDAWLRLAGWLRKRKPSGLDASIHQEHDRQFSSVDCLDCANCCRSAPALLNQRDMDRIARHLGISTADFLHKHVEMDEDGDFVLNTVPCFFLRPDNRCSIYEVRPDSCADYPHTRRRNQATLTHLLVENAGICPAVFRILERLEREFPAR